MTSVSAVAGRSGRLVFFIGGALFILSGLAAFMLAPVTPAGEWFYRLFDGDAFSMYETVLAYTGRVLSSLAVIVFAVGAPSGGSVVARKPLGMIALVVFALWPYLSLVTSLTVPYEVMAGLPWAVSTVFALVPVVAGFIAVVEIARIGAVPGWWRWLPAAAYLAVVGPMVFVDVAQQLDWNNGEAYAPVIVMPFVVYLFASFVVPLVLGTSAVALALVAGRRATAHARAETGLSATPAAGEGLG